MWVYPRVWDGDNYALALGDLVRFSHLEKPQVPLVFADAIWLSRGGWQGDGGSHNQRSQGGI